MNPRITEIVARMFHRARCCLIVLATGIVVSVFANPAFAQHSYAAPEAAAEAFVDAVKRHDEVAMKTILGANWKTFIPTQDFEDVDAFVAEWDKSHRVEATAPGLVQISVGEQQWTLPIPLIHRPSGWQFDVQTGADEMRTRRIGRNELAAMQAALAYFDAQKEYARIDRTGAGVLQYAQKFTSSSGKHDGLYWPANADEAESPLGPLYASYKPGEPYHGYRFKILTAQGKDARGGAYSYLIKGRMVSGFALVAWPLHYGDSGIMSFMVSHDGQLYQKDLGEKTNTIAPSMTLFNPDPSWQKVTPP